MILMNQNLVEIKPKMDLISSLIAKTFSLKIIQAVIFFITTYEQDMIEVGNENEKN